MSQPSISQKCLDDNIGAAAQIVCVDGNVVYKATKPCGNTLDMKCVWLQIKQRYTYMNWKKYYNDLEIVSSISLIDYNSILMTKEKHHQDVQPNKTKNRILLQELQSKLEANDHLLLDAYPKANAFLGDEGQIILIDFTIIPSFLKTYAFNIEFLEEYPNIAAGDNDRMRKWFSDDSSKSHDP